MWIYFPGIFSLNLLFTIFLFFLITNDKYTLDEDGELPFEDSGKVWFLAGKNCTFLFFSSHSYRIKNVFALKPSLNAMIIKVILTHFWDRVFQNYFASHVWDVATFESLLDRFYPQLQSRWTEQKFRGVCDWLFSIVGPGAEQDWLVRPHRLTALANTS